MRVHRPHHWSTVTHPALQLEQTDAPAVLYCPEGHTTAAAAPAHAHPAVQTRQLLAPLPLYCPAAHGVCVGDDDAAAQT